MVKTRKKLNYEAILEQKVYKRRREIRRRKKKGYLFSNKSNNNKTIIKDVVSAPVDLRFIDNPVACLRFFNELRSLENCSIIKGAFIVRVSLSKVTQIDFATISILKCIFEESKFHKIAYKGNLPKDVECREYLVHSGFLNNLLDGNDKEIKIKGKGEHFSLEKKQGILTVRDLENFDKISEEAYKHVFQKPGFSDEIITLIKEIGGNAVEWSNSHNNQWQIGILKEKDKVIFNVTDLGKGILETIYVSNKLRIIDLFLVRDDLDILKRAFERKYGSLSQEVNRNRGLPSIKRIYDENKITNLLVCSNNVFLDFNNSIKSFSFKKRSLNFFGTFYQWELDRTCL